MNHNVLQHPGARYAVALSVATSLVFGAELAPEEEVSEPVHMTQTAAVKVIEESSPENTNNFDTILCARPGGDDPLTEYDVAERCKKSYKNRKFALVDFTSLSEYTMREIADDTESGLRWATAGIIRSTVEVVEPTKAVARKLKESRPEGCIDSQNPSKYASVFAKEHMPELYKYDHIMAVTDIPSCPDAEEKVRAAGVAESAPGRFADVFDAANMYKRDGVLQVKKVTIHEGGHLLGLDHYSTVRCQSSVGKKPYRNGQMPPLDVLAYLGECQYFEYATQQHNIMGHSTGEVEALQPGPLQRHDLLWPEKVLRGEAAVPGKRVDATGLIFSVKGVEKGNQYGIIDLDKEAVVYDDKQEPKPHTFTQVSLVPELRYSEKNTPYIDYVRAYLSDENGRHVDIGPVISASSQKPVQRFLSFGNQVIELEIRRDQVMMRQTSSK